MSDIENEEDDIIKPINLNLQFSKMRRSSRIGAQSTKTALPTSRRRIAAKGIRTGTQITSSKRKLSDITNTSQQMPRRGPEKGTLFPKGKRFKKATPTPSPSTKSSLSFDSSSSLAPSVSTSLRTKNDQGKIKTLQDKDKSEGSTKGDSRIHSKKHLPTQSNTKRTSLPTVSHRDEGYLKSTASAKGKMRTKVVNMDNQTETNSRPSSTMTSKKTRLSLTETKNLQNEKKDLLNEKKRF